MSIKVLDHGFVRLVEAWGHGDEGEDMEAGIIEAARQSTQGSFCGWEQDEKLLKFLHNNKHATPFEFAGMVIEVKAPLFVFREWHRHRTQSYNEMSARYAPLPNEHYLPSMERTMIQVSGNKQADKLAGSEELTHSGALRWLRSLEDLYTQAEAVYQNGLNIGVPKELARLPMPVARYSQMRASTCLRNWLSFLTLRQSPQAQWEIREYANAVGMLIELNFPRTWRLFCENRNATHSS